MLSDMKYLISFINYAFFNNNKQKHLNNSPHVQNLVNFPATKCTVVVFMTIILVGSWHNQY